MTTGPGSTRVAWTLLVVAAGAIGWTYLQGVRIDPRLQPTVDRSREAPSVDPLRASPAELQLLPGIGPGLSRSIHHDLRVLDIDSIEALQTLPGIGPVRAAAILESVSPGMDD